MPRLTADQWSAIRLEWEGEPMATFHSLGPKYGIDKASISRKAAKEGWAKRGVLADINGVECGLGRCCQRKDRFRPGHTVIEVPGVSYRT